MDCSSYRKQAVIQKEIVEWLITKALRHDGLKTDSVMHYKTPWICHSVPTQEVTDIKIQIEAPSSETFQNHTHRETTFTPQQFDILTFSAVMWNAGIWFSSGSLDVS